MDGLVCIEITELLKIAQSFGDLHIHAGKRQNWDYIQAGYIVGNHGLV